MLCPLDWWGRWKRGDPGMQVPLLLLLFGVAHTLFPLWRSYSCRGVCVGLPLIHRSSFTFWETWGWTSNWHQAFFCQWMPHTGSPQAFYRASYRIPQSGSEEHRCGAPKGGQQFRVEVKNEVLRWENENQQEEKRLFTSCTPPGTLPDQQWEMCCNIKAERIMSSKGNICETIW